jgi:hypothetical protein
MRTILLLAASLLIPVSLPAAAFAQATQIPLCRMVRTFESGITGEIRLFTEPGGGTSASVFMTFKSIQISTKGVDLRPPAQPELKLVLRLKNGAWERSGSGGLTTNAVAYEAGTRRPIGEWRQSFGAGDFRRENSPSMAPFTFEGEPDMSLVLGMANDDMTGLLQAADKSGLIYSVARDAAAPARSVQARIEAAGAWSAAETMRQLWPVVEKGRVQGQCRTR